MYSGLVTVGLISCNAISTIERAAKSILSQTWHNLDIVCVDDCSLDGTFEYLRELYSSNSKFRLFRNSENLGVASCRNKVLSEAKGEFIVFFDDDDESRPNRIKAQLECILAYEKAYPNAEFVISHTAREVIYPGGSTIIQKPTGSSSFNSGLIVPNGEAVAKNVLIGGHITDNGACPTCCQMARTSSYQKVGGFDERFRRLEDTDFIIRASLLGGHFVGLSEPLVIQHMTKNVTKSIGIEFFYTKMLLDKHKNFLDSLGEYDFCMRWIKLRHEILSDSYRDGCKTAFLIICKNPILFFRRLYLSLKNYQINLYFRRFHRQ